MLNNVSIMGRFANEPELRTTASGKSVTSFTLAVPRNYDKEKTDWIDCVAWEKTAEHICKYFRKGSLICVQGSIQTRTFELNNGDKRKATELIVEQSHFCEKKQDGNNTVGGYAVNTTPAYVDMTDDDDLPF